ncbi:MAG: catalase [Lachnospiraceae bacterium]|nr:catalase [Lachnospiraceae bacterium]
MNVWGHFKTITKHRIEVMKNCFAVGLYFQGLTHDLSKYSPTEFIEGCRYYQGYRSPNNAEREDKGYSASWLHHKGRNKHHYEYWIDYSAEAENTDNKRGGMVPVRMPKKYLVEMFMDRIAASKTYNGEKYTEEFPLKYFERSMDKIMMHPDTKRELHALLKIYAKYGQRRTFRFIKERFLK